MVRKKAGSRSTIIRRYFLCRYADPQVAAATARGQGGSCGAAGERCGDRCCAEQVPATVAPLCDHSLQSSRAPAVLQLRRES